MNRNLPTLAILSAVVLTTGCVRYYPPPSPPAPVVAVVPPLLQQAERNGFETGRMDGARDAQNGLPPHPRSTRAYHTTPGYAPQMGPYPVYRNHFRNAYLRGYQRGYYAG